MDHAKLLLIFATVLQQGSMNKAGAVLGMSASAVSQHIRNLEQHYNIKLLNRNTRSLAPTEAGRKLWGYAEQLKHLVSECDMAMTELQAIPQGNVVLSLPSGYVALPQIQALIQNIRNNYPKIRLILRSSDNLNDLLNEKIDITIRTVLPDNDDFIARELVTWEMTLCATQTYLSMNAVAQKSDLLTAHWLNFNDNVLKNILIALDLPSDLPHHRTDCSVSDSRILMLSGLGITVLLAGESEPLIKRGEVIELFPMLPKPSRTLYAITTHRNPSAKVNAVLTELKAVFSI